MKINQLFRKHVDLDMVAQVLDCFNLTSFSDRRMFSKNDLLHFQTIEKIELLKLQLADYYLPCKAKVYLDNINENRAITILKQILRLYDQHLVSKEKNINNKKIIFYQIQSHSEVQVQQNMIKIEGGATVTFM